VISRQLDHLREMQRPALRRVLDLRAAREAGRHDECVGAPLTLRQQHALAAGHRDVVVSPLVPPGAGHAAAAAVGHLDLDAHRLEQLPVRVDRARRVLVAVLVQHGLAHERRRLVALLLEELGQVVRLVREPLRVLVVRPHLQQLVLQDGNAA